MGIKKIYKQWVVFFKLAKAIKRFISVCVDETYNADYVIGTEASIASFGEGYHMVQLTFELLDEKTFNEKYRINLDDYLEHLATEE